MHPRLRQSKPQQLRCPLPPPPPPLPRGRCLSIHGAERDDADGDDKHLCQGDRDTAVGSEGDVQDDAEVGKADETGGEDGAGDGTEDGAEDGDMTLRTCAGCAWSRSCLPLDTDSDTACVAVAAYFVSVAASAACALCYSVRRWCAERQFRHGYGYDYTLGELSKCET
ncbi:hypothetical protein C8R47DRAFT_288593 [Mycena vitilis]|nr:hypothetical protein C8R47DRAFT_288593 [Mycena vitilis]